MPAVPGATVAAGLAAVAPGALTLDEPTTPAAEGRASTAGPTPTPAARRASPCRVLPSIVISRPCAISIRASWPPSASAGRPEIAEDRGTAGASPALLFEVWAPARWPWPSSIEPTRNALEAAPTIPNLLDRRIEVSPG